MKSDRLDIKYKPHVDENLEEKYSLKMLKDKNYKQNGSELIKQIKGWFEFEEKLKWFNIITIFLLHAATFYGIVFIGMFSNMTTFLWGYFLGYFQGISVTAGMHRLWTHRSYKAKWPIRFLFMFGYCMAGQTPPISWVRDHRVHHKCTDTKADPHDSTRGFFFSHVGWLMMKKHSEVIRKGRELDLTDLYEDPIFMFGNRYFIFLKTFLCFVIPIVVPVYMWNETWFKSIIVIGCIRYALNLNFTWAVNSVAHLGSMKPYDANINPSESVLVSFLTYGEGSHNYHHVFPWDYRAAELGRFHINLTTRIIEILAKLGLVYDLKKPSEEVIKSVVLRKGDGSHHIWGDVPHPDEKTE